MSTLYDTDIVLWSEQQADLLRRLARGEQPNDLDWENVIEEVESVGRSQIDGVASRLVRMLEHLLKAAAWPQAPSVRKWLHEANVLQRDARRRWAPSMISRITVTDLYGDAIANVRDLAFEEGPSAPLLETCPVTLGDLITGDILRDLAPRFRPPA